MSLCPASSGHSEGFCKSLRLLNCTDFVLFCTVFLFPFLFVCRSMVGIHAQYCRRLALEDGLALRGRWMQNRNFV
jgi:hypothetical protein